MRCDAAPTMLGRYPSPGANSSQSNVNHNTAGTRPSIATTTARCTPINRPFEPIQASSRRNSRAVRVQIAPNMTMPPATINAGLRTALDVSEMILPISPGGTGWTAFQNTYGAPSSSRFRLNTSRISEGNGLRITAPSTRNRIPNATVATTPADSTAVCCQTAESGPSIVHAQPMPERSIWNVRNFPPRQRAARPCPNTSCAAVANSSPKYANGIERHREPVAASDQKRLPCRILHPPVDRQLNSSSSASRWT